MCLWFTWTGTAAGRNQSNASPFQITKMLNLQTGTMKHPQWFKIEAGNRLDRIRGTSVWRSRAALNDRQADRFVVNQQPE